MFAELILVLALMQQPQDKITLIVDDRAEIVTVEAAESEFARLTQQSKLTVNEEHRYVAIMNALGIYKAIQQCTANQKQYGTRLNNVTCLPE